MRTGSLSTHQPNVETCAVIQHRTSSNDSPIICTLCRQPGPDRAGDDGCQYGMEGLLQLRLSEDAA